MKYYTIRFIKINEENIIHKLLNSFRINYSKYLIIYVKLFKVSMSILIIRWKACYITPLMFSPPHLRNKSLCRIFVLRIKSRTFGNKSPKDVLEHDWISQMNATNKCVKQKLYFKQMPKFYPFNTVLFICIWNFWQILITLNTNSLLCALNHLVKYFLK